MTQGPGISHGAIRSPQNSPSPTPCRSGLVRGIAEILLSKLRGPTEKGITEMGVPVNCFGWKEGSKVVGSESHGERTVRLCRGES